MLIQDIKAQTRATTTPAEKTPHVWTNNMTNLLLTTKLHIVVTSHVQLLK